MTPFRTIQSIWEGASAFEHKVKMSLLHIAENQEALMAKYDQLIADVTKQSNLSQALMDALTANTTMMKEALAQVDSSADTSALQQALSQIEANNDKMAAAVLANTTALGGNTANATVKNDGPTEQQNSSSGLVPPTTGNATAGLTNPGPDQAPASTAVDAPTAASAPTAEVPQNGTNAAGSGTGANAATGAQDGVADGSANAKK